MTFEPFLKCELKGCTSTGIEKGSIARVMVYDGDTPTMTRPAEVCQRCVDFAVHCGLRVVRVPMGAR